MDAEALSASQPPYRPKMRTTELKVGARVKTHNMLTLSTCPVGVMAKDVVLEVRRISDASVTLVRVNEADKLIVAKKAGAWVVGEEWRVNRVHQTSSAVRLPHKLNKNVEFISAL